MTRAWPGVVIWLINEIHAAMRHGVQLPMKLGRDLTDALIRASEIARALFYGLMFPASEGEPEWASP